MEQKSLVGFNLLAIHVLNTLAISFSYVYIASYYIYAVSCILPLFI